MKVFISWANEPSKTVADALRDWLPDVLQSVQLFMSSADIDAGGRWSPTIASALASSSFGIVCVTPSNQHDPWLTFEAGALAKTLENTFVCPYLIGLAPGEMLAGPLTQFQAKTADKAGTLELLSTINKRMGTEALATERLQRVFEKSWSDFESQLSRLPKRRPATSRKTDEMIAEVVEVVRSISRRLPSETEGSIRDDAPAVVLERQAYALLRVGEEMFVNGEVEAAQSAFGAAFSLTRSLHNPKLAKLLDQRIGELEHFLRARPAD